MFEFYYKSIFFIDLCTSLDWYQELNGELEKVGSDAQKAEKVFIKTLSNSGISILKGTDIDANNINWQQIEYNQPNDNVVTKPCD